MDNFFYFLFLTLFNIVHKGVLWGNIDGLGFYSSEKTSLPVEHNPNPTPHPTPPQPLQGKKTERRKKVDPSAHHIIPRLAHNYYE